MNQATVARPALLEARGVRWSDVAQILEQRTSQSGLAEKAARAMPED